jgi:NodT family efflux transporter outer membrane factor (OMF) lipoprotein
LLARQRCEADRRQVQLVLTEEGQKLAALLPHIGAEAMNELAAASPEELKTLEQILKKILVAAGDAITLLRVGENEQQTLRTGLSLVLLAMTLAGCANYSGLNTEGVSLEAKNLKAGQSLSGVKSPAAWPKSDWWTSLGDPQLDGLIREALHDSPDMQIADARAHQASAAAYAADAARMPTLDASAGVTRSRLARDQDPSGQGDYATVRNIGASFNYNFDLWGGQRDAWEAALGQARAAEIDQQAAQLTLSADVARAYSDLGQAHIVYDLAAEDLKRTRQMLDLSQRRLSAGIDSQYQFQQTESLEATSEANLIDAEKRLQSAKIALAVLLGKGPDRGNEIARPKVLQASAVALPSVLPAELLGRRPDLVAARWRVEAASKNIDAGKTRLSQLEPERGGRCPIVVG